MKPNLHRQNMWYYHTTICKKKLGPGAPIFHFYVFGSPCSRVFCAEKTQEK
jgi:hypothetical protein